MTALARGRIDMVIIDTLVSRLGHAGPRMHIFSSRSTPAASFRQVGQQIVHDLFLMDGALGCHHDFRQRAIPARFYRLAGPCPSALCRLIVRRRESPASAAEIT